MANGDDRKLVPDPDEDQFARGRRNLMLRNAAAESRPRYTPAELTAPAMPEAPDLVPAPPAPEEHATPMVGPAKPPSYRERLAQHYEDVYRKRYPEEEPGYQPPTGWGKVGHVLRNVGEDIATAIAPRIMGNIPGTKEYREQDLKRTGEALGLEEERESLGEYRKAQLPKIGAETERDIAEAGKARAETAALGGPKEITGERGTATNPLTGETLQGYEYRGPGGTLSSIYVPPGTSPPARMEEPQPPKQGIPGMMPSIGGAPLPTPARPSGLPEGFQVGKPSVESDRQNFLRLYNKQGRTPQEEQYVQGHLPEYENIIPVGAEKAAQMNREIAAMPNINPGLFTIGAGATLRDAKDLMTAARNASTTERLAKAPEEAQRRKDEREMGYAINPTNNKLEYMSRAQAEDYRTLFEPVKNTQTDRVNIRQLNDIQKNMGEFRNAILAPTGNLEHTSAMRRIMAGVNPSDVEKMGFITMGAAMQMMEQGEVVKAWQELDDKEKKLMVGYLRAKGAMIAYNKVLAGSARQNKEALNVDWQNLPTPDMGAQVAMPLMDAVQENLDQIEAGFPTNLPGLKDPFATKREVQTKGERERGGQAGPPKNFKEWQQQKQQPQ